MLANDNVASAIIGASRPEQIADNVQAVGQELGVDTLAAIDEALGDKINSDGSVVGKASPADRLR